MRNSNHQSIGDILNRLVKEQKLEDRLQEVELISCWNEIVGAFMAKHTTEIRLNKNILYVHIDSPACREELMYNRSALTEEINNRFKKTLISEIIIR